MDAKAAERDKQWSAYRDWQDDVAQLQAAARQVRHQARLKPGGKGDSGDKFAKGFFGNRATKNMVGRAKHIERRVEHLLTAERVEKPKQSWHMKLDFGATPMSGRDVLMLEDLSVGYATPLLASLNQTLRFGARAVLIGPNGLGKTTLLKTIAGQLPPLAGRARLGANVRLGYMAQEQETLDPVLNALETISRLTPFTETEVRNFLHYYLFAGDDVFTPVGSLSYGERARLLLASLVAQGCNFLLLDEPLNHLDLPSRTRFEQALTGFDGTVLAVTHDRYFISSFASEVWEVKDGGLFVREV
jgi:ATP-binding cassette subfamily F protein 3